MTSEVFNDIIPMLRGFSVLKSRWERMTLEELKDSDFVVGMKETERAIEKREASAVFIASDCDERISAPLLSACQASDIPAIQEFTKKEIGRACGIKVKAAAAAVLKKC